MRSRINALEGDLANGLFHIGRYDKSVKSIYGERRTYTF